MPGSFELAYHLLKAHLLESSVSIQQCNYQFDWKLSRAPTDMFNFTNYNISNS